jgi:hypothetical protein
MNKATAMTNIDRDRIEDLVLTGMEDITGVLRDRIQRTDRMLQDLRIDTDAFSFVFVPSVEKALGIKTT